jgi:hypothetical protein
MTFPAYTLKLHQEEAFAGAIRAVNRFVSQGESVYRWQGPQTSFADPGDLIFPTTIDNKALPTAASKEFPESALNYLAPFKAGRVALLWDKSFLWGYLAVSILRELGFRFDLLTAEAVGKGGLNGYQLLVVPGGWASLKSEALGATGRDELRKYVRSGGGYLGLCGGAGLALQVDEGLALLPVTRKPMAERLPNFSGSIQVRRTEAHPLWWGLQGEISFQVWWPSQFDLVEPERVKIIGRYGKPESDFCVSDLNVCDTLEAGLDWEQLERAYGINLDPERLLNEPAILEGRYGEGRVVLSYPHLETPGNALSNLALFNIWYDSLGTCAAKDDTGADMVNLPAFIEVDKESMARVRRMAQEAKQLIELGKKCHLWAWRNPWLLLWKRGVLGAEFGAVSVLLSGLADELERIGVIASVGVAPSSQNMSPLVEKLERLWNSFQSKGRTLVEAEERSLSGQKDRNGVELGSQVRILRTAVFNCVQCYGSKSYDGLYRQLLDQIDFLLLRALLVGLKQ